ncbi:MAG: PFL family protein [Candidatus Methanomethylophilaceae archaeon]|nr:PFL family protein [Candidatus Methanomethylophilaceae archaeon]MDY5872599.1 PFL family protein [Candidatus Methanomethylophilaceae archaeon]
MAMITLNEVLETNKMIEHENLDVRTITMGINLMDCMTDDLDTLNRNIYDKITGLAKDLVSVGNEIGLEYGVPIVNKRVSVTPIAMVGSSACKTPDDFVTIAKTLDRAAKTIGVNFIGGYSALVMKGMTAADRMLIQSIPKALKETDFVCSSISVGSSRTGINMDAVRMMGDIIKETAEATKDNDSLGCAKLVVFCNPADDNPFMAGAFHGVTEGDAVLNVGVSGPGVVKTAVEKVRGENFEVLCETIKKTAFKVTRIGQLVGKDASERLGIPFGILDLSLAPTPAIGDSIADILQGMGLERVGAPGTTAALAILNDQVKKGGVMASSYVGGLSGAFIPVSEDQSMADAAEMGALTLEKLEAMTCVCSVGLDMIAIPGNTSAATISGIIADEMAIGMINNKTTAVRLIPVIGKDVGDQAEFGGLLGSAPIMPVNKYGCEEFVNRGGRIPAPIHSFKN